MDSQDSKRPRRDDYDGRETRRDDRRDYAASERDDKNGQDLDPRRLYVANLSERTRETDLTEAFQKWGRVKETKIIIDAITQRARGYAFVTMEEPEDGVLAQKESDKKLELDGKVLTVETARGKQERAPRERGSYSGRDAYPSRDSSSYSSGPADPRSRRPDPRYDPYGDPRDRRERAPYEADYRGRAAYPPGRYEGYPPPGYPMMPPEYGYPPYGRDERYAYPRGRDPREAYSGGRREDRESFRGAYPPVAYPPLEDYYRGGAPPSRDYERGRGDWDRDGRRESETDRNRDKDRDAPRGRGDDRDKARGGDWEDRKRPVRDDPYERDDHRRDSKRDERR
eukprot:TRINITY_DN1617_c0_g1_i1.p1 TRINITY_DN1617_c0_g1~~TRINITY_DN1617_c0_g1_i1.p1  ORF type:complete len:340 (+),score=31.44 TRINITY_DN1617_c0_g1_i1:210-1229(+)